MKHFILVAIATLAITQSAAANGPGLIFGPPAGIPLPGEIAEQPVARPVQPNFSAPDLNQGTPNYGRPVQISATPCGSHAHQNLIGQPLVVAYQQGVGHQARILHPGQITNMLYIFDRLNISVGGDEIILRVYCG